MRIALVAGLIFFLAVLIAGQVIQSYDSRVERVANAFAEEYRQWATIHNNTATAKKRSLMEKQQWERVKEKWVLLNQEIESLQ